MGLRPSPRIGIIGAGLAGLVAARILQEHGLSTTVFDRDSSAEARAQGGVLDMHVEGGQYAFQKCGLYEEFLQVARYDEQDMVLYDKTGELHFFEPSLPDGDRPEVDRPDIRRILLASVAPETISWESAFIAVDQALPGRSVTLHFRNAPSATFDLVIGADGAWSRLRPAVSEAEPVYAGATFYELHYSASANQDAGLLALTRKGNMFAMGDRQVINSHRTALGGVHVYAGLWTGDKPGPALTRDDLLERFQTWSPALLRFLTLAENHTSTRTIAALPIGHRWPHRSGITLVGDAAHLMSPFSGEGANLAMRDAADLALMVVHAHQQGADMDSAVAAFENIMCARAQEAATGAAAGVVQAFTKNAVVTVAAEMKEMLHR